MSNFWETLGTLLPELDPQQARQDAAGAGRIRPKTTPTETPQETNYLPILVVGLAGALLLWATMRPSPLGSAVGSPDQYQREEWEEERPHYHGASYGGS